MAAIQPPVAPARTSPPQPFPIPIVAALSLPVKLRWRLVGHYRETGQRAAWAALVEAIGASGDDTTRMLEERARLAYTTGERGEAERLLLERVERAPSATASIALGRFYLGTGDLKRAAAISHELAEAQPDLITVNQFAAEVATSQGRTDVARVSYEQILDAKPEHTGALLSLAQFALDDDETQAAREMIDRATAPEQEWLSTKQLRTAAGLLEAAGHPEAAAGLIERASEQEATRLNQLADEVASAVGETTSDRTPTAAAVPPTNGALAPAAPNPPPSAEPLQVVDPSPVVDIEAIRPGTMATLQELFGFPTLRPGQAAVIANVLARKDTLATMPTGAGKSLTFQFPAMLLDGATVVISPLIALMKDQVESLPAAVRERTVLINSSLSSGEQRRALEVIAGGEAKLIYAAPERLRHHEFLRALHDANVALLVIDEAHCISLWGHDFRPDYLTIPAVLPALGEPAVLAITATATPAMAVAIGEGLGRDLDRIQTTLFRANLQYEAIRCANREDKLAKITAIARQERGAGIVYVGSRRDADAIAALLRDRNVNAVSYHAGLDQETRARAQERFMSGAARVVVATVAFGMGVDKADVRFIIHLSPPRSLESYAQESGRAGRDGEPARCVLLYSTADKAQLNRLARLDQLGMGVLREVYAAISQRAVGSWAILDPERLLPPAGPDEERTDPRIAIGILSQAGLVRQHSDAPLYRTVAIAPDDTDEARPAADAAWDRFRDWAGLDGSGATERFETAQACEALQTSPADLNTLLASRPDVVVRDGPRLTCLEVLSSGPDARQRIEAVLDRSARAASQRIEQVMRYAAGRACRHQVLAAHLGERIDPCGDSCDVCRGTPAGPAAAAAKPASPVRSLTTADDALAVLEAVRTVPFSVGKTGLVRLLLGSVESRIQADRSPAFGRMREVSKTRVEALVDRLVEDGFLLRDLDHEYKLIRLTPQGAAATGGDLQDYGQVAASAASAAGDVDPALLERLTAWRRERAAEDDVPAYVVAHNTMLEDIARMHPESPSQLGQIAGFGPKRIDRYGDEIMAAVRNESA